MRTRLLISGAVAAVLCLGGAGAAPGAGAAGGALRRAITWPSAQRYKEAMHNPEQYIRDPKLRGAKVKSDKRGAPAAYTGSFGSVYRVTTNSGRRIALRVFHPTPKVPERYDQAVFLNRWFKLGEELAALRAVGRQPPEILEFALVPDALSIDGQLLPVLKLPWVSGRNLDDWIGKRLQQGRAAALRTLASNWREAMHDMRKVGLAHGDFHHGNIKLEPSGVMRYLDYDSMFASALSGFENSEIGHQNFQHPSFHFPAPRLRPFDRDMDNFSALVIYTSLLAVADDPSLWRRYHHDDNLIFEGGRDFADPDGSPLFAELRRSANPITRGLANLLARYAKGPAHAVPSLERAIEAATTPWYRH
jgi:hypothetical protein